MRFVDFNRLIKNYFIGKILNSKIKVHNNKIIRLTVGDYIAENYNTLVNNNFKNINKRKYELKVYGNKYKTKDGTCIRDYIDVNDLTNLHVKAYEYIQKNKSILFNCGYQKPLSVLNVIKLFETIINKKIKKNFVKKRSGDIEEVYSDTAKLKKFFPKFKKKYSTSQSIQNMIEWEKRV
jgi:UDP-glucose 4-epimerase